MYFVFIIIAVIQTSHYRRVSVQHVYNVTIREHNIFVIVSINIYIYVEIESYFKTIAKRVCWHHGSNDTQYFYWYGI